MDHYFGFPGSLSVPASLIAGIYACYMSPYISSNMRCIPVGLSNCLHCHISVLRTSISLLGWELYNTVTRKYFITHTHTHTHIGYNKLLVIQGTYGDKMLNLQIHCT